VPGADLTECSLRPYTLTDGFSGTTEVFMANADPRQDARTRESLHASGHVRATDHRVQRLRELQGEFRQNGFEWLMHLFACAMMITLCVTILNVEYENYRRLEFVLVRTCQCLCSSPSLRCRW
jgi:hypothetical protein